MVAPRKKQKSALKEAITRGELPSAAGPVVNTYTAYFDIVGDAIVASQLTIATVAQTLRHDGRDMPVPLLVPRDEGASDKVEDSAALQAGALPEGPNL